MVGDLSKHYARSPSLEIRAGLHESGGAKAPGQRDIDDDQ